MKIVFQLNQTFIKKSLYWKQELKMKLGNLSEMIGGWFIGDFEPSLIKNKDFEASVKYYKKGDEEFKHMHKVATEITVMNLEKQL